ncbi:D-alanyl-D-alanine carboxypeptidase family protein [Lactobacillus hominis]|uniref:serine-type D-Ala-D-Ala carboxypeptidase n=1 Tax=Lactobacillus hominis DSM 23910 = CRBIP 24.179 TaxID=1423758 RepID=I7L9X3_9LACO|nr:D-alanyl-D-alanine carboxypeptidase family protein [Lactobacillus hominis]KRM85725.1 serine-type D-Ala-D-Ala carboxypeptidase [Lactobacillus hominis DSM 23910 = CRBIP 24.179]MCT3347228.1 D-alanyl-D-alanine carboxypeptidase [Lactobacillus hominis]CCI81754.1 Serine-type D-Ala-D-Ala carboxypeptidase [Lactobacillus hominis DSM 23910 = CRBIP 24.179]
MKKINKWLLLPITFIILFCVGCSQKNTNPVKLPAPATSYQENSLDLKVKSAVAFDLKNGQIFYAKNATKKYPVASMSKLITIYLTLQAIKDGKISWDQEVTPDKDIVSVANNQDFANVAIKLNHSYTIRQLYQATLIQSANDAAMMLAKAVSGNQQKFVIQMRELLKSWGINDAQIYTPDGLPNYSLGSQKFTDNKMAENELSANDMGIVIQHLLKDYPQVIETTKIAKLDFKDENSNFQMQNWNWMLPGLSQYDAQFPVDGLKTGTTDAAGACFAGTMVKNGRRIVTVVMGAKHVDSSDPSRFDETKKLLTFIFNNYQLYIFKKGQKLNGTNTVSVKSGRPKKVTPVLQEDNGVWLRNNQKLQMQFNQNFITAPVNKGEKVGTLIDTSIPALNKNNALTLPATVNENIKSANFFSQIFN